MSNARVMAEATLCPLAVGGFAETANSGRGPHVKEVWALCGKDLAGCM